MKEDKKEGEKIEYEKTIERNWEKLLAQVEEKIVKERPEKLEIEQ